MSNTLKFVTKNKKLLRDWLRGFNEGKLYLRFANAIPSAPYLEFLKSDPELMAMLTKIIDKQKNKKEDYSKLLWSLLVLEFWHKVFIDDGITHE